MTLLDPTYIRDNCDYSFGDLSGIHTGGAPLLNSYIKEANLQNREFLEKLIEIKERRNYMTLFIDNIRLYKRPVKYSACELENDFSRNFKDKIVKESHEKNDLLKLCSLFPKMNFIIFTAFDDSPIDEFIFDKIPENVIRIFASNATTFGGKVSPIPYGIKRRFTMNDTKQETLRYFLEKKTEPSKLLYINHNVNTNPERKKLHDIFIDKNWCTIAQNKGYEEYLNDIKNHKFMICPSGNAIGCECHRDWEVLYMKRVPIVIDSAYLREIFKDFPVLFVKSFETITEDLLLQNNILFEEAQKLEYHRLDFSLLFEKYLKIALEEINKKERNGN